MENIFTPEMANMPVTYGDLMAILTPLMEEVTKGNSDITMKMIDKLGDYMVKIRDDAEYNRLRDIRFVLTYLAKLWGCDRDRMYDSYKSWSEEFDKLNKPTADLEDANG